MNKIENFIINVKGENRFEKREKVAEWITEFVHNDPDCRGVRIEQVNMANESKFVYWTISAYGSLYVWIDLFMDGELSMSRLEKLHEKHIEILFSDDFETDALLPYVVAASKKYGQDVLFPKPHQEIKNYSHSSSDKCEGQGTDST